VSVQELDESDQVLRGFSSLTVFQAGGGMRTISFGLEAPRQPALTATHVAFLSDDAMLRVVEVSAEEFRIPPVQVFETARETLRPRRP
jgi:hypothetical protein